MNPRIFPLHQMIQAVRIGNGTWMMGFGNAMMAVRVTMDILITEADIMIANHHCIKAKIISIIKKVHLLREFQTVQSKRVQGLEVV